MSFFNKMIEIAKSMGVKNFAFYKKWALDHLKKQLDEEETVTKALEYCEEYLEKAYGVGTIREWKGKKYIKGPDKKWRRYFDKHDRGANQAIKNIMREINSLENGDVEGLYAIIQKNAGRFRDENGNVLPEVQQIHDLVEKKQSGDTEKNSATENKKPTKELSPLQKYENSIRDEKYEQARKDAEMRNQNQKKEEIIDGPYGRKFTIDEAKKEIEGQIRYLREMKENIGKQPKGRLARDTENFIENLMGKLKPEDRKDLETMYDEYKNGGKENEKNGFEGTNIEKGIKEVASTDKVNKYVKDTSVESFCSKDQNRFSLTGVYNDPDGYKVATEGHMLFAEKTDITEEMAGKITFKNGVTNEGNFPNWKKVVPENAEKTNLFDDRQSLLKLCLLGNKLSKLNKKKPFYVKIGKFFFNTNLIGKCLAVAEKKDLNDVTIKENGTVLFKGPKGMAVTLPMINFNESTGYLDAESKMFYGQQSDAVKEFLGTKAESTDPKLEEDLIDNNGGVKKSFLEQIEEISKSTNRSHLVKKQVTDKNGRVRTVWVNPLDKEQMKKRKADIADLRDFTGKEKEKAIIEDAIKEVLGGEIEKMRNIDFPKDASKNMYMVDMNYDTIKSKMKNANENLKAALEKKGVKVVGDVRDNHFDAHWEFSKKYPAIHRFSFYLENSQETKKSFLNQVIEISKSVNGEKQPKQKHDLEYYKKWAMSILDKQKEEPEEDGPNEETIVKALAYTEMIAKAGYPVGTIREWKGQKYIKIAPNKWKPKYDNMNGRGAKMSLTNLKKAVAKCNSEEELFNLINSNASRFRDENGRPFPEVQELHDLINKRQDEINTPENNVEKPENGSGNENGSDNGNTAPEDSGKEPEKKEKTPISDKISAIQNAGNKGKMEVEKLSQGNVEGVAADAGDDTVNAVKNAAKSDKELLESYPTNVSGKEYFEAFLSRTKSDEDHFSHAFDQLDKARNYDDRDEIKGDIISLLYSYQRDIDDIGSDKKALAKMRELFDSAEKDEYNSSPEYLKNAFEQLKKIKEETKYEKISDAIKRSRELDDLNREIEESGKTVAEFLRDKNKKKDEEGMSNKAEQDQDKRVGSSALWDQNVKNAIKTGDANQIKSAIAKVEKEYEILSKRAKTENEKEFLEYELKYRKRDAENALKELNTKIDGGKKETLESLTEKYNATKDPDEREKILNEMMNLDRQDEEKTLPAMFDKEDESFDAWDKDQKAKYGDKSVEELQKLLDTKYKNVKKYTPEYSEAMKIGDMIQQKKRQKK
ncbi:MAG: hypothetical protein MJZ37_01250 [Bacilli bacterium]|nr:hypothetical protein [Bacilli bacterium]